MPKEKVFLTGASGTIGSALLETLIATGNYEVDCLVRDSKKAATIEHAGGRALLADMADAPFFEQWAGRCDYIFVIHTAQANDPGLTGQQIHDLDRQAVSLLERIRTPVTKLMVYTSGVWIFGGMQPGEYIHEQRPLRPFAAARLRAELVAELKNNPSRGWAQLCPPSMVYGEVGPLKNDAAWLKSATVDVLDDDSIQWSMIERFDLARAYLALLEHGQPGDFYVVAEDAPVSVPHYYEALARAVGKGRVRRRSRAELLTSIPAETRETRWASQPVDSTFFKSRTGWRARETFATTVTTLVNRWE